MAVHDAPEYAPTPFGIMVHMSKSKAEHRYWASDFDSQCGSLAITKSSI